jgi:hypothetical protein
MAVQSIALPVDIPWKRLGASADMVDTTYGDAAFPPRWRSSVAVFYHEPADVPEAYCDRQITYLKITCSITGYQLDQKEVGFEFDPTAKIFKAVPIVVWARGSAAAGVWPRMALRVNGGDIQEWDVNTADYRPYVAGAQLIRGNNRIEVAFLNDAVIEGADRNLFVDRITVGARPMSPLDAGVVYNHRDANGVSYQAAGQREMWSQGELVFTFDYQPQDWMTQLVEEYDNLAAYLPCYGALLHVGVYPKTRVKTEVRRTRVSFESRDVSEAVANPLDIDGARFQAAAGVANHVIADVPGRTRALGVGQSLTITVPASIRLEATLYAGAAATVEAYRGEARVGVKNLLGAAAQAQTVVFEGDGLTRLVIGAPGDEAWLAELRFDTSFESDLAPSDFPYVMDFEPKKRELYETVTESGESLSRSATNLNIRKGSTDTNSVEDVDIFQGANGGFKIGGDAFAVEASGGVQGQWGGRTVRGAEHVNLRTTDDSREKRETFSHATTLSQLFHLFTGYHLGTNRSLFLMLPRPHVTEVTENGRLARTFVKGPRRLEGVQDIFLVVNRPRGVEGICVETLLETAHLNWEIEQTIQETKTEPPALPTHHDIEVFLTEKYREKAFPYYHTGDEETYHYVVINYYWDPGSGSFLTNAYRQEKTSVHTNPALGAKSYEDALDEYLRDNPPPAVAPADPVRTVTTRTQMILTARSVKGCVSGHSGECGEHAGPETLSAAGGDEWVSFESAIDIDPALTDKNARVPSRTVASNQLVQRIGRTLQASLGSRERYRKGEVGFLRSRYTLDRLRQRAALMPADDPHNARIGDLVGGDERFRGFTKAFPEARTRKDALALPPAAIKERLGLSDRDARDLQLRLIGLALPDDKRGPAGRKPPSDTPPPADKKRQRS